MLKVLQPRHWYIIQCSSGIEKRVAQSLSENIKLHNMDHFFGQVMIPAEEVLEMRGQHRRRTERKFFPGYILVQMHINEASLNLVRSIPGIMGFIGGTAASPAPMSNQEIDNIKLLMKKSITKPKQKLLFYPGEIIRVNEGPFEDFQGVVEEVDYEKNRLKISVSIFGRSTPVELNFRQVEKN
ncbi:MAG: transcription termination/antitermination protein NusG [Candidatus Dasytiphilus stammeri]